MYKTPNEIKYACDRPPSVYDFTGCPFRQVLRPFLLKIIAQSITTSLNLICPLFILVFIRKIIVWRWLCSRNSRCSWNSWSRGTSRYGRSPRKRWPRWSSWSTGRQGRFRKSRGSRPRRPQGPSRALGR